MNASRPLRATALLGVASLVLLACGGDDDTADDPVADSVADEPAADEPAADEPADVANQPASITFEAQESDGTSITVAAIELPAAGFVAVHGDGDGGPGPVIGHSDLLPAGTSTDVVVTLDQPLADDATLYPMVHIDTDQNGVYEFGVVEGADGPGLTADGDVAVVGAAVTITGEAAAGESSITIADFAFSGVTEVAVGTTVTVTNTDASNHTWTAAGGAFDSGGLREGESFEFTFTEPGTYDYFCAIHPNMTGTIVVTG